VWSRREVIAYVATFSSIAQPVSQSGMSSKGCKEEPLNFSTAYKYSRNKCQECCGNPSKCTRLLQMQPRAQFFILSLVMGYVYNGKILFEVEQLEKRLIIFQ